MRWVRRGAYWLICFVGAFVYATWYAFRSPQTELFIMSWLFLSLLLTWTESRVLEDQEWPED